MDIKDLTGLGQPLTKLLEVLASGVGRVSRSYFARKDADAKAYEVRRLAEALNESSKLLGPVAYTKDGLSLSATGQPELLQPEDIPGQRMLSRISYQEAKKQINIESVAQQAAEELRDDESVSEDQVDEDWVTRFFSIVENVSNEQMQQLWGKILAGEVRNPSTYSLRTLEALRNFSQEEAAVIAKTAQAALIDSTGAFILRPPFNDAFLEEVMGISFKDVLLLKDINILRAAENLNLTFGPLPVASTNILEHGNMGIVIERQPNSQPGEIPITAYTDIGKELLSLVQPPPNLNYARKVATYAQSEGVKVVYGEIAERKGNAFRFTNMQEVVPL